jgi:hypothetical protein
MGVFEIVKPLSKYPKCRVEFDCVEICAGLLCGKGEKMKRISSEF